MFWSLEIPFKTGFTVYLTNIRCVDGLFVSFNDYKHNGHESPKMLAFCFAVLFSTLAYSAQWRDKPLNESASPLTLNLFSPVDAALARAPPVGLAHSLGRCELAAMCPSARESLSQPSACQATQPILVPRLRPVKHNRINRFVPEHWAFTLVLPTCDINALCAWFHGMEI